MSTRTEILKRESLETAELEKQALALGIEIPPTKGWWDDDTEDQIENGASLQDLEYVVSYYLTPLGKAGARRLIREELARLKDRKIRWACQIIAAITGLAGAVIGILAIILAMLRK